MIRPARGPAAGAGSAALVFAAVARLRFLSAFLAGRPLFGTDYLAGGYPFLDQISARLADGALPGWLPGIFGGVPPHANPGSIYHRCACSPTWFARSLG